MTLELNELTKKIIGAAIEIHKELGPGLLESAYEACLCHELELNNIPYQSQLILPITYKGLVIERGYRIDIFVDRKIVLELKAVESITSDHEAQLLTYLKFSESKIGLIINFNAKFLKDGIKRMIL